MRTNKGQTGFSVVEIAMVLAVVVLLGAVGYLVVMRQASNKNQQAAQSSQTEVNDVSSQPQITSNEDLDKAIKTLDENDPALSDKDAGQLDGELSQF